VIMHAGRIATPEMAEEALKQGWLDVCCMTKSHIADPHLTLKAFENRLADIRYCTRCLQACHGHMETMTCVYNPLTSRELAWAKTDPAVKRKRIIIVGAGPAGMECALTAHARGHEVIVLERAQRVGGQIWAGAASPLRKNWARIAEFYRNQADKRSFDIRLNTDATREMILDLKPDAVVIATGSSPNRLHLEGDGNVLTVHEVVAGHADRAKRAIVYDREGFNRPLVAADYLSSHGVHVDLVSPLPTIGGLVEGMMLEELVDQLTHRGVQFRPGVEIASWTRGAVQLRNVQDGKAFQLEKVDAVVATIGSTAVATLPDQLRGPVNEVHVIGDAREPATVEAATYQGAHLARTL